MTAAEIHGEVRPEFAPVRDLLRRHLDRHWDIGFGLCVYRHGEPVIDLWGGHVDAASRRTWDSSSLVPLTSISKTVLATVILQLSQTGALSLDVPISEYWPEFGAEGKNDITLGCAMSHQAGIPAFIQPVTLRDELTWAPIVEQLQELRPIWQPGSAHGYHAIVLGFLLVEVLRRVTSRKASELVRELVADPLSLDLQLQLSGADTTRLVEIIPMADDLMPVSLNPEHTEYANGFVDSDSLLYRATFGSTAMTFEDMNNPAYYTTDRPAAYGSAHAVAKMYAALFGDVSGHRLLTPRSLATARTPRAEGRDEVFAVPSRWGTGFMLTGGPLLPELGAGAFGHIGSTGAIAFADPEADLSFAFLPNKMKSVFEIPDRRAEALVTLVYRVVRSC